MVKSYLSSYFSNKKNYVVKLEGTIPYLVNVSIGTSWIKTSKIEA